jgi:valyl-tRNA synthetase
MEKQEQGQGSAPKTEEQLAIEKQKKEKKDAKAAAKAAKIAKAKEKQAGQKKETKPADNNNKPAEGTEKKNEKKEKGIRLKTAYVNTTPKGDKKDVSNDDAFLHEDSAYDPSVVEAAWYDWWEAQGYFKPEYNTDPNAEKFVIVIPPPNVTGSLHLGHALTNSIQDSVARWHRMNGKKVLWVPGTDHAGIATQTAVEKRIKKDGLTRHDLGREQFLSKVWEWKNEYGGRILQQLRRLGSSLDWSREVFTMDDKLSRAVREAFVRMHDMKLIYRANRLVNWCCALKTAISDIEVDAEELEKKTKKRVPGYEKEYEFGLIYKFCYQVEGSEELLEIATTRPETMLGDTAVAVHPDDTRYKHLHGKFLVHPFVQRRIPIVTDPILVDMAFGTGVVKVTPAHDQNDFECGKRHNLPMINILDDDGRINENGGEFKGMKRFEARDAIIVALKKLGHFKGSAANKMVLKTCSRSGDIIEPLLKPQWWVDCKEMARRAGEAVTNKQLEILPPRYTNTWFEWLRDIRDWCISRQLWWGHRIPAWLVTLHGQTADGADPNCWIVARDENEARAKAEAKFGKDKVASLAQDPDVLDTWFSSGLFPFSVFGWPDNTSDLQQYYPTQLLETGKDILFFWVMRMVMMGLTLTDQLPFKQVFLHPIVRDAHGEKMAKSKGNVIDPIDVIEGITLQQLHEGLYKGNLDSRDIEAAIEVQKRDFPQGISECGTDALRFALCSYIGGQGNDINLDINRVVAYRNFCNKLWNATKLAFTFMGHDFVPTNYSETKRTGHETEWDTWILGRLQCAVEGANKGFESYEFSDSTQAIYSFWLYDFCDVYLEAIKPLMSAAPTEIRDTVKNTL